MVEGEVLNKRSNVVNKKPTKEQLKYGEFAVNYAKGSESIFMKNDNDEIVQFDPLKKEDVLQVNGNSLTADEQKSIRDSIGLGNVDNMSLIKYTEARGDNLITNGNGNMGNNYNFPDAIYDPINVNNCAGSFKLSGPWKQANCTEKISIDLSAKYKFSVDIMLDHLENNRYSYCYINCYDIDGNEIQAPYVYFLENTLTTLKQDLKPGDTKVYLEDVSKFQHRDESFCRGFIFWNYKDSLGYQYPPETYSRNYASKLWSVTDDSFKDVTANTITLDNPWTGATVPTGTKLSQCSDSGTYSYILYPYSANYDFSKWQHFDVIFGKEKIRTATRKISMGFLVQIDTNNVGVNGATWFANVNLSKYAVSEEPTAITPAEIDTIL